MAPTARPKAYQLNTVYEVGDFYIQFPSADTNTTADAFPTNKYPAVKFGGTWTAMWTTEAISFRTQGDPLTQTDGENNARTDGLQTDMMQGVQYHVVRNNGNTYQGDTGTILDGTRSYINSFAGYGSADNQYCLRGTANVANGGRTSGAIEDDANGPPRTGKETRMRNRLFIIWKRTA